MKRTTVVIAEHPINGPTRFASLAAAARHFGKKYSTFAPMVCRAIKMTWKVEDCWWRYENVAETRKPVVLEFPDEL